ncbi:MAG: transposase [Ilumatobacteraceae bacterium]
MPRRYPVEFGRTVLDLIETGRPVVEIAAQLGVSDQTIYNWRNQDRLDHGLRPGVTTAESVELAAESMNTASETTARGAATSTRDARSTACSEHRTTPPTATQRTTPLESGQGASLRLVASGHGLGATSAGSHPRLSAWTVQRS